MSVDRRLEKAIRECQCKLEVEWRVRDLLLRRLEQVQWEQERNWEEVARLEKRMLLLLDLESLQLHKELFGEELEEA